ncbi:sulfurtransferase [Corynebacterium otitidis]|uniref:sulfurtransferase n=1 Tax=Corynebacterium otitidis TaxID=29321 RepID=UPI0006280035|nr:sulfurtransferase [Corynebacterium otitidis]KKO84380.1 thiosulfate sulfurtransferase [Corynebacterium otitidis]
MPLPADPDERFQQYAHPERLVSASWLSSQLGVYGLKVIESNEDPLLYNIGHIPTAINIDWQRDLKDPYSRDFIDAEAFAKLMREKGIERTDTVVIYGDKYNWWAAYTLWVFELFGHEDVRLLDGGRDSWMAEERDTAFLAPTYPESSYPVPERDDATLRALRPTVERASTESTATLIDVRPHDVYTGETPAEPNHGQKSVLSPGHIPGAINRVWRDAVTTTGHFRPADELREGFEDLDRDRPVITYCHLGDRSAHTWFTLKHLLGFENVRNYDGSWSEWGNIVQAPIAVGEDPEGSES